MKALVALAAGYLVGAKTGGKDLDQLGRSLKALCETEEFADVIAAARAQVGSSLRELASLIDGHRAGEPGSGAGSGSGSGDLLAQVRHLVGRSE
jgi:hypothetical protein